MFHDARIVDDVGYMRQPPGDIRRGIAASLAVDHAAKIGVAFSLWLK